MYGYHNSPGGKSADLHVTVVVKEKRGDAFSLNYIYTADGTIWDRLHVPKGARAYGYTKGNVLAVISAEDFKEARGYVLQFAELGIIQKAELYFLYSWYLFSQTGQTLPGKKVKTYWVSADGKTADEIELTTLEKIKDTDRNKIVQGHLRAVPKADFDKCVETF